jgi:hypothetical protein
MIWVLSFEGCTDLQILVLQNCDIAEMRKLERQYRNSRCDGDVHAEGSDSDESVSLQFNFIAHVYHGENGITVVNDWEKLRSLLESSLVIYNNGSSLDGTCHFSPLLRTSPGTKELRKLWGLNLRAMNYPMRGRFGKDQVLQYMSDAHFLQTVNSFAFKMSTRSGGNDWQRKKVEFEKPISAADTHMLNRIWTKEQEEKALPYQWLGDTEVHLMLFLLNNKLWNMYQDSPKVYFVAPDFYNAILQNTSILQNQKEKENEKEISTLSKQLLKYVPPVEFVKKLECMVFPVCKDGHWRLVTLQLPKEAW